MDGSFHRRVHFLPFLTGVRFGGVGGSAGVSADVLPAVPFSAIKRWSSVVVNGRNRPEASRPNGKCVPVTVCWFCTGIPPSSPRLRLPRVIPPVTPPPVVAPRVKGNCVPGTALRGAGAKAFGVGGVGAGGSASPPVLPPI